uniref:Uncharacterized protein n=1 Tax=Anguilla anguilla TaxID=7936 RepID=A0A0E9UNY4_ANGAN
MEEEPINMNFIATLMQIVLSCMCSEWICMNTNYLYVVICRVDTTIQR